MHGHAYGTTITRAGNPIGELTSIGGIELSMDTVDVTSHESTDAYREFVAGLIDTGEVALEGNFDPDDTAGQLALRTDLESRNSVAFVITLPAAFGTSWAFDAFVTKFKVGDMPVDGKVSFSASLKIDGKPALSISASNNLTALTCTDDKGAANFAPNFAAAIYDYVVVLDAAASTYHYNATFAAGTCTIRDGKGGTQTVLTTVDSSEISAPAADSFHIDTVTVKETGKVPKVYTIRVYRP